MHDHKFFVSFYIKKEKSAHVIIVAECYIGYLVLSMVTWCLYSDNMVFIRTSVIVSTVFALLLRFFLNLLFFQLVNYSKKQFKIKISKDFTK